MARIQWLLLCLSVAVLLVTPCDAARGLRVTGRSLLTKTSSSEKQSDLTRESGEEGVPTSSMERGSEFNEWARFLAQEVAADYTTPGANPDPGTPPP